MIILTQNKQAIWNFDDRWINNNKSLFGGEYKQALVPEDIACEWWRDNT